MSYHNNSYLPQSNPSYPNDSQYDTTNASYRGGHQTSGSVGTNSGQWSMNKPASSGERFYASYNANSNTNGDSTPGQGLALRAGPPTYPVQPGLPATPRRAPTFGRQLEELHIPQSASAMSDVHHYGQPPAYGGDITMNVQPSTPQHPQHPASVGPTGVPGSLQPGSSTRPDLTSSNTAPTLPQLSTQMQQQQRPMALTSSHSYSKSSPGNMDQTKYKPFSNTPEQQKYASPTTSNYMPQTPQGAPSTSPLGLADIRQRAEAGYSDGPLSPGFFSEGEPQQQPSNSNYIAPWPIYALDWCKWPAKSTTSGVGKVAIGSYLEDNHNFLQILEAQRAPIDPDNPHADRGLEFIRTAEASHSYPVTRILWEPFSANKQTTDLLATSGDHLRLWSLPADQSTYASNSITRSKKDQPVQKLMPLALLSNSKSPEHTAPITSLDWNVVSPSLIITSSIDTTCTIWDIPTLTAKTQLIAHDKEVFDVRFCAASVDVFVSCGADGSVRMFDLRSLEHSTIIYEPSDKTDKSQLSPSENSSPTRGGTSSSLAFPPALLRIAASPHDAHLLATFSQDSSVIRVLDVRQPGQALLELRGHGSAVNCIEWSHTQRGVLASGGDDSCVLVWDLMGSHAATISPSASGGNSVPSSAGGHGPAAPVAATAVTNQERGPTSAWECGFEISNLSWAPSSSALTGTPGVLGVVAGRGLWGVQM